MGATDDDDGDGDAGRSSAVAAATTDAPSDATPTQKKREHKRRKASKGRLKKLWRRASGPPPGIASPVEWEELAGLHSDWRASRQSGDGDSNDNGGGGGGVATDREAMMGPLPGPSVVPTGAARARDFSDASGWQATEGSDHRDLIANLLFRDGGGGDGDISPPTGPANKKRKIASTGEGNNGGDPNPSVHVPPLASWATIGNLGGVGGVAVVEVDVVGGGDGDAPCPLMPSRRIADAASAQEENVWSSLARRTSDEGPNGNGDRGTVGRAIGAACRVKLFQGNKQPRSLSDVLMFVPPAPAEDKPNEQTARTDVLCAMNELRLTPCQLRSEGFPIEDPASTSSVDRSGAEAARKRVLRISEATTPEERMRRASEPGALEAASALSAKVESGERAEGAADDDKRDDFAKDEHHVKSFSRGGSERRPKVFAVDCEMVETSAGPELARVSVIEFSDGGTDENGKDDSSTANEGEESVVVLDELVKPRRRILNYLTEYSGISARMLKEVDARIEHVQLCLLSLIDADDILVGHSLENDLRALRFVHTKVVDTSVLFRASTGRKFGLRHLSNVLLRRKIQRGTSGHCSTEDAEAALALALRRARRGESFALKEGSQRRRIPILFQKAHRATTGGSSFAERSEGSCVCMGPDDWISKYASGGTHHVLSCESITSSMSMAVPSWLSSEKSSRRAGLLWANLRCEGSKDGKGWRESEINKLDEMVKALVDRVPSHTPILLMFQRNFKRAWALTQQRKAANNPKSACGWTSAQEEQWKDALEQSRHCEAVWIGSAG